MTIRFRTQDTKASWARKLNALLTPIVADVPSAVHHFKDTPQTWEQWLHKLNYTRKLLVTAHYTHIKVMPFRDQDESRLTCRKLNQMARTIAAGKVS